MEVFRMVVFIGLVGLAISGPAPISEDIFTRGSDSGSTGNTMRLRGHGFISCPIDFVSQNYTILTSQCKAPDYDATLCCTAFKQFACPIAEEVNKINANCCASLMLRSFSAYAKYKAPIMFLDKCRKSKLGLSCDEIMKDTSHKTHPGKSP